MRSLYYKLLSIFSFIPNFFLKNRLRVLAYHDIKDQVKFKDQINYLNKKYNIISIFEFKLYLESQKPLPKYSLLLTFDDGDVSVLEKGLPVLKKYNCPICLFIITSLINTNEEFWWNRIYRNGNKLNENIEETKKKLNILKTVSNKKRLKELDNYPYFSNKQLTLEDLEILQNNKVYLGNHSHTHPMFDKCDEKEILTELENSKKFYNANNLEGYDIFAYPNGNFDKNSEKILNERGIKLSFLFDHKINPTKINPMRISRIRANSDMTIPELKTKVSGLHFLLLSFKNKLKQ